MDRDIVLLHRHFDAAHLDEVKAQMAELGAPAIRAIWDETYGVYLAVEGCHRLRACVDLGVEPVIEEVEVSAERLELMVNEDLGLGMEDEKSLGDLIDDLQRSYCHGYTITFEQLQQQAARI